MRQCPFPSRGSSGARRTAEGVQFLDLSAHIRNESKRNPLRRKISNYQAVSCFRVDSSLSGHLKRVCLFIPPFDENLSVFHGVNMLRPPRVEGRLDHFVSPAIRCLLKHGTDPIARSRLRRGIIAIIVSIQKPVLEIIRRFRIKLRVLDLPSIGGPAQPLRVQHALVDFRTGPRAQVMHVQRERAGRLHREVGDIVAFCRPRGAKNRPGSDRLVGSIDQIVDEERERGHAIHGLQIEEIAAVGGKTKWTVHVLQVWDPIQAGSWIVQVGIAVRGNHKTGVR